MIEFSICKRWLFYGRSVPIACLRRLKWDYLLFERILKKEMQIAVDIQLPLIGALSRLLGKPGTPRSDRLLPVYACQRGAFFVTNQITYHNTQKRPENDYTEF